jgi:predicted glycogen debranching enzyme
MRLGCRPPQAGFGRWRDGAAENFVAEQNILRRPPNLRRVSRIWTGSQSSCKGDAMQETPPFDARDEWLEADGLGGFASGTVSGVRTRRYHALLLSAARPPAGRFVLVNGLDAVVSTRAGEFSISSQAYAPGVVSPDGERRIEAFSPDPWPRWRFRLEDGSAVEQEICARRDSPLVIVTWRRTGGRGPAALSVLPFLSGRDYHALHHENSSFRFTPERSRGWLVWRPYDGVPAIAALANGEFGEEPHWYRDFLYEEERDRGLDCAEDLAAPGRFRFDLRREAVLVFAALTPGTALPEGDAEAVAKRTRAAEKRRRSGFSSRLERAAEDYVARRAGGRTIIAGYPWFTDWGRDTFIALRGLCHATGRIEAARDILNEWAGAVSEGMLPNRFPDQGDEPEYNSVDASLWFVVAVHDYLRTLEAARRRPAPAERGALLRAVEAILDGYTRGTRFGIRMDGDGLLAAGVPGAQLTWMDAKVGDRVITPRIGKPVEIQALWLNALRFGSTVEERFAESYRRGLAAFRERFFYAEGGFLFDVVDCDHRPGAVDASFRPNQIFAVGGLPWPLLEGDMARRVVDAVEERLLTPLGLRSLAPGEPGYTPRYEGGVAERDGSYHQGTVWPWLMGPFVEAWVRVRGGTEAARREARARFLQPLLERHLGAAGIGHVSEIADAEPPHRPRGCPFQAWSVGEILRLDRDVLATPAPKVNLRRRSRIGKGMTEARA